MLSPDISRLLAKKKQLAIFNKDYDMIKKIENIKYDWQVTKEIKEYK